MPISPNDLAVQSYCFRGFKDNAEVAELVKKIGVTNIELCAVHVKFDEPDTWDAILKTYADAGVGIVSIGVEGFRTDEAAARRRFDFARKAGCKVLSANFDPASWQEAFPIVDKLSKEYGIKAAIHNHGGYHWLGNSQMLDYLFSVAPESIGLCMDTAWALDAKQNPLKWAENYKSRLYSVHVKDFIFDRARQHEDVVVGTGNLQLPELFKTLNANNFAGPVICEYEGDINDPTPALTECITAMKAACAS